MSISSQISALQQDKSDIITALTNKGATVPSGSGFDDFATIISSLPISQVAYFEDYARETPQTNEPFIRENDGTIHYIQHTVDFTPKGFIFSCITTGANLNSCLPEISGKTTRSIYNISFADRSVYSGDYNVLTGLVAIRGTTVSYSSLPTSSYEITNNTIKIGKTDSSANAFRFGMSDDPTVTGVSNAGVIYQLFIFG